MVSYYWLSAHLYSHNIPLHEVIYEFLPSFLTKLKKQITVKKYFYVRYFDDVGVHIRLRMLIKEADQAFLKSYLDMQYRSFFYSTQQSPDDVKNLIRYIKYVPEIERYGGVNSIKVAEDFFYLSSKTILSIGKKIDIGNYAVAVSVVLKLHLAFLRSLSTDKNKIRLMLLSLIDHWLTSALSKVNDKINPQIVTNTSKEVCIAYFQKKYEEDRDNIIIILSDEHILMDSDLNKKNSLLKQWAKHNHILFNRLDDPIPDKETENTNQHILNPASPFRTALSFIHMTNNRIGIKNSDESYLAYILLRFLDETNH